MDQQVAYVTHTMSSYRDFVVKEEGTLSMKLVEEYCRMGEDTTLVRVREPCKIKEFCPFR